MKVSIQGFIHTQSREHADTRTFSFFGCDMSEYGYVKVAPYTITTDIEIDEALLTKSEIEALRAEQQKIRAEAHAKVMNLEERISKLLALEHKS
jgi:hypothetical protein